jgi:restriction system protein
VAVPDFQSITLPLLKLLSDGKPRQLRVAVQELADRLGLTQEQRTELLPSGTQPRFANRVGWARFHMDRAGLVSRSADGATSITELGKSALITPPERITTAYLRENFPAYAEFMKASTPENVAPLESPTERTPEEVMEVSHGALTARLRAELLVQVKAQSPEFFEDLVVDLLVKMGYGGSFGSARRVGRSGDGGIDGIIDQDQLGLDVVYVQAKRWEATVGSPTLQTFAGSLEAKRATKGVIITTSQFSADAREFVRLIGKRIVLVDGEQLAQLMDRLRCRRHRSGFIQAAQNLS